MLPFVFEWRWDIGHGVFMGLFFLALTVIALGVVGALAMTFYDLYSGKEVHEEGHGEEEPWADYSYKHDKADRGEYA
jgi:hypothetical protein